MGMRAVIVDDERNAREALRGLLSLWCPDVEVVAEADSVASGFKAIQEYHPDTVFLDVEMGDGTGFDLLKRLRDRPFALIFTTAFQQYAIAAIRMSASDFLLKPIDPDELVEAVGRAQKQLHHTHSADAIDVLLSHTAGVKERIVLKDMENIYVVKIKDVVRCEADGRYTRFFVSGMEKPVMVRTHLKEYETLLIPHGFVRVHHSHLVQLDLIERIDKVSMNIHMRGGHKVPVSVRKKDDLLGLL
jgi:two-component system, LytTR family, response regulator